MQQKKPRRTRSELRDLMVKAGREVLFDLEASMGFEQLTYSRVFAHLAEHYNQRVTIGSVHERIWMSQRDFQLAVVAEAIRDPVTPTTDLARDRALATIASLDLSTPELRRNAIRTAIRLNSQNLFSSPQQAAIKIVHMVRFHLWAVGPDHPEAAGFTDVLTALRQESTQAYANVARLITEAVGIRVRPSAGNPDEVFETLALLGNATSIGLETEVLAAARTQRQLPTGPGGAMEDWYPDAIALWAFVTLMFELDGDDLTDDERQLQSPVG